MSCGCPDVRAFRDMRVRAGARRCESFAGRGEEQGSETSLFLGL